jgi:hypothetical protein
LRAAGDIFRSKLGCQPMTVTVRLRMHPLLRRPCVRTYRPKLHTSRIPQFGLWQAVAYTVPSSRLQLHLPEQYRPACMRQLVREQCDGASRSRVRVHAHGTRGAAPSVRPSWPAGDGTGRQAGGRGGPGAASLSTSLARAVAVAGVQCSASLHGTQATRCPSSPGPAAARWWWSTGRRQRERWTRPGTAGRAGQGQQGNRPLQLLAQL